MFELGPISHDGKKRFRNLEYIGKGGFCKCYSGIDAETNEIIVVKRGCAELCGKKLERTNRNLLKEHSIHSMMDHPCIPRMIDIFEEKEKKSASKPEIYNCLVMERCEHKDLLGICKTRFRRQLSLNEIRYVCAYIIPALEYIHNEKKVIHRDVKPGNIFIDENMGIKLGDFGLSITQKDASSTNAIAGTPNYIAFEILKGKKRGYELTLAVDVWSLGVSMYTMYFGKPPFETHDVKSTYRKIMESEPNYREGPFGRSNPDKILCDLLRKMLRKDPKKRITLREMWQHPFLHCFPKMEEFVEDKELRPNLLVGLNCTELSEWQEKMDERVREASLKCEVCTAYDFAVSQTTAGSPLEQAELSCALDTDSEEAENLARENETLRARIAELKVAIATTASRCASAAKGPTASPKQAPRLGETASVLINNKMDRVRDPEGNHHTNETQESAQVTALTDVLTTREKDDDDTIKDEEDDLPTPPLLQKRKEPVQKSLEEERRVYMTRSQTAKMRRQKILTN